MIYSCGTFSSQPPTKGAPNRSFKKFVVSKSIRDKFQKTFALVEKTSTQLSCIHESRVQPKQCVLETSWTILCPPLPQPPCSDYTLCVIIRSWCQELKSGHHLWNETRMFLYICFRWALSIIMYTALILKLILSLLKLLVTVFNIYCLLGKISVYSVHFYNLPSHLEDFIHNYVQEMPNSWHNLKVVQLQIGQRF